MDDRVVAWQAVAHERSGEEEMFRKFVNLLADILIASASARASIESDELAEEPGSVVSSPDARSTEGSE